MAVHCLLVGRKKIGRGGVRFWSYRYRTSLQPFCVVWEVRKREGRDASFGVPARHKTRQAGDIIPTLPAQFYSYHYTRVAEASFLFCGNHSQLSPPIVCCSPYVTFIFSSSFLGA